MSRWRCSYPDTPKQKSLLEPGREAITETELSGGRRWAKDMREPHRKHLGSMCMQTDRLGLPLYRMMRKSWDQPERQAYDLPRLLLLNREQSPVQTEMGSVKRKMQG